jgi:hypothetical protein
MHTTIYKKDYPPHTFFTPIINNFFTVQEMDKFFLICITLFVFIFFLITTMTVEEVGADTLGIIMACILPLLGLAWIVYICFERDM